MENANDHPFKVSIVKDAKFFANSHPYKVTIEGGGGTEGKVVDELPEEGETGYIYLVLKEETEEGNIYDEYMWVLQQDETYGWEHIGATNEVKIVLYDEMGTNTDGAMTQKATTELVYRDNSRSRINIGGALDDSAGAQRGINIGRWIADSRAGKVPSDGIVIANSADWNNPGFGTTLISAQSSGYVDSRWYQDVLINSAGSHSSSCRAQYCVLIGEGSQVSESGSITMYNGSIALGAYSLITKNGEMNIGSTNTSYGYNNTNYRLLTGVHDPIDAHDAATKGYVDDKIGQIETVLQAITTGNGV